MGKLAFNVVDVSIVSKLCHVNGVRSSFVHLLTSLTIGTYLSYKTNVRSSIRPKKGLRAKEDIWSNIMGIRIPYPPQILGTKNYSIMGFNQDLRLCKVNMITTRL